MERTRRHRVAIAIGIMILVGASLSVATVRRHELPNGLTVITAPHEWNRIVSVSFVVGAGSKYDPPGRRGLAHVTNELLARGTETMSALELAELLDGSGIHLETYTTEDYAMVSLASSDTQFDQIIDILGEIVASPALEGHQLIDVQKKTRDALEGEQDDTFARSYLKLNRLLFGEHPYAYPTAGTPEGVDAITPSDVESFYGERYRGGNSVIAIVGSFDPAVAVSALGARLQDYPRGTAERVVFPEVEAHEATEIEIYRAASRGYVQIGFLAPSIGAKDHAAVSVLTSVLGDGTASRLYQALGPDGAGLADVAGAFYPGRFEAGQIVIYTESADVDQTIDIVGEVVQGVWDGPITDEELVRAKNRVKGRWLLKGQTNLEQARRLAVGELSGLGYGFYGDTYVKQIERVDSEDVLAAAREYLENPAKVIQRPAEPPRKRKAGI